MMETLSPYTVAARSRKLIGVNGICEPLEHSTRSCVMVTFSLVLAMYGWYLLNLCNIYTAVKMDLVY